MGKCHLGWLVKILWDSPCMRAILKLLNTLELTFSAIRRNFCHKTAVYWYTVDKLLRNAKYQTLLDLSENQG